MAKLFGASPRKHLKLANAVWYCAAIHKVEKPHTNTNRDFRGAAVSYCIQVEVGKQPIFYMGRSIIGGSNEHKTDISACYA